MPHGGRRFSLRLRDLQAPGKGTRERIPMGNKLEDLPLFLTPQQLADVTGEHVNSIRRGIAEKRIPADKVNGRWRICRDKVFPNACGGDGDGARS